MKGKLKFLTKEEILGDINLLSEIFRNSVCSYHYQVQRNKKIEAFRRLQDDSLECIKEQIDRLYTMVVPNYDKRLGFHDTNLIDDGTSEKVSEEVIKLRRIEIKASQMKEIARVDDICRYVLGKIATLYKLPPKRSVMKNDKPDLFLSDSYREILEYNCFDEQMKEIEIQKEFLGDTECKITWIQESKKFIITFIPSYLCDVITDPQNPKKAIAKLIKQETLNHYNEKEIYYECWTENNVYIFDEDFKLKNIEENPDNTNSYGIIPLVTFRRKIPVGEYYNRVDEELLTTQQSIDKANIELEWIKHFESFPIPVLKNFKGQFDLTIDPMTPLVFPPTGPNGLESSLEFISPNVKIKELRDDISELKYIVYTKKGIPPQQIQTISSNMSGKSLELLSDDIVVEWDKRKISAVNFENELYSTIRTIENNLGVLAFDPEKEFLEIMFTKVKKQETAEQREKRINNDLDLGLTNVYEIYSDENSVDLETATEKVNENIKMRNRVRNEFND